MLRRVGGHCLARAVAFAMGIPMLSAAAPVYAQRAVAPVPPMPATQSEATGSAQSREREPAGSALDRKVTLDMRDVPLKVVLDEIDRQARLGLTYTPRLVPVRTKVTIRVKDATAAAALKIVLRGTKVVPVLTSAGMVMLAEPDTSDARTAGVRTGAVIVHVVDSVANEPLAGVVVAVKGTSHSTTTNGLGYGLLRDVPVGLQTITARFFGYMPAERTVAVIDSQPVRVELRMHLGRSRLEEVVTTATGSRRRLEVPNDITLIDVDSVMAVAPIHSVTDLLETRVPGLTVQRTTGAPGDPKRLRLRGVSSVYGNNDPVVIVDGVRVYAAQSDERGGNLASSSTTIGRSKGAMLREANVGFAAPSPLDQIDPNSIETIEVVKGPSASTLYGPDAANGVIVITTKKGRAGPARWSVSASQGLSDLPGRYPDAYFRWGHDNVSRGVRRLCPLTDFSCTSDSLVTFQALNDPTLTVLDRGRSTSLSLGVSGGTNSLTYSVTGSWLDETGLLRLPTIEAERYQALHGSAPPNWMQRPQEHTRWGATSNLTMQIGSSATATLVSMLTREHQQHSTLEQQLAVLMGTYVDRTNQVFYQVNTGSGSLLSVGNTLVPDFYHRVTDNATNFTNGATLQWRPLTWLTTTARAGLNIINRQDAALLPPDMLFTGDSIGTLTTARGSSVVSSVSAMALASTPLPLGFTFRFGLGADFRKSSIADLKTSVEGLADGTTGLNGAGKIVSAAENMRDETTYGWYLAPSFTHRRFSIDLGLRLDGGSTYGTNVRLPVFPKVGGSWLISDEHWFPFKGFFNTLRLRASYGHAGVQPGIADRLRLYTRSQSWIDGSLSNVNRIKTLGNTQVRPERSTELEGGFDADVLDDRFSITFSGYQKLRKDALIQVPLAPSVYGLGQTILKNVGVVRNTGVEATLTTQLVRTDPVTWSSRVALSRERNMVVSLAPGVEPFDIYNAGRIAPGYPLFGRWTRPIRGYADANENGIIEANEVRLGDTLVFMGPTMPNYRATFSSTLDLFRGALSVNAAFEYQDGLTQVNQTAKRNSYLSPALNDPNSPFEQQAAVAVMNLTDYGITQTVNTLRFNSLSVAYNARPTVARRLGARSLSIALQGSNLGLFTNYTGKDPNVNAYATGNGIADTGQLPQPRYWQVSIRLGY